MEEVCCRQISSETESNKKHCSSTSNSEWASLPMDIFYLILEKLLEPVDHVRLAAVCKHWQSVSEEYNHATQRWSKLLPMLMVPFCSRTKRMVYSVSEGKLYTNVQLQVPYDRRCSGSSHGWLATTDETFAITLMNPFKKVLPIILPRLVIPNYERHRNEYKKRYEYYVQKVIMSADPHLNPDNYVVVAIYDLVYRRLAFIRAGQKSWTYIKETRGFVDINFYNSQIYAVIQKRGEIVSLDFSSSNDPSQPPTVNHLTQPLPSYNEKNPFSFADMEYLVKSTSGDLLHVQRFCRSEKQDDKFIESFAVYKLVFNENDGSIVQQLEVESIGDDALFLGDNHSFCISASSFNKCKPNSIYYTNDTIYPKPRGMGIFSLATRTISQHYSLNPRAWYIPRAIWIEPQFNGLCSHESHHKS